MDHMGIAIHTDCWKFAKKTLNPKKKAKPNIHTMAGLLTSIMDMSYFIYQKDKKTIDKIVSFAKNKAKNNEY